MTDYNRYTTPKGQLLLNIKPPSSQGVIIPPPPTTKSNINSDPYSRTKIQPYQNPQNLYIQGNSQIGYPLQNAQRSPSSLQSQPIQFRQPQPVNKYQNIPNPQIPQQTQIYTQPINRQPQQYPPPTNPYQNYIQQPSNRLYGNQAPPINDYYTLGADDSDNSQKRSRKGKGKKNNVIQQNKTVCCFPGYWLLLMLLGVVAIAFVLILIRAENGFNTDQRQYNNGTDLNNQTNDTSTNSNNNSNSSENTKNQSDTSNNQNSSSPNTQTNTNTNTNSQTQFQFPPADQSSSSPSSVQPIPISPIPVQNSNPPSQVQQSYIGSVTQFQFPPNKRHQLHANQQKI